MRNAIVGGETRQEYARESTLAQIARKPRPCLPVGLAKRRIAVDRAAIALAHNQLGVRDVESRREIGAARSLDAMVGPCDLRAVVKHHRRKG